MRLDYVLKNKHKYALNCFEQHWEGLRDHL